MRRYYLKKAKYRNSKVAIGGDTYDSMKEYRRYLDLLALENAGEIKDLRRQVKYILLPAQREPDTIGKRGGIHKGKLLEKEVAYYADFVYTDSDGKLIVEDTKGIRTKDYIIKRKMMLYFHKIQIHEV